jgi:hypothetical protein
MTNYNPIPDGEERARAAILAFGLVHLSGIVWCKGPFYTFWALDY